MLRKTTSTLSILFLLSLLSSPLAAMDNGAGASSASAPDPDEAEFLPRQKKEKEPYFPPVLINLGQMAEPIGDTVKEKIKDAASKGFYGGITQIVAALVTQVPINIATSIVSSIANKIMGHGTSKLQEDTILIKLQAETSEKVCAQAYTKPEKEQCTHLRAQLRAMMLAHGENMKKAMGAK